MEAQLVGQAPGRDANLYGFLDRVSADVDLTSLTVAVAWVKESGLSRALSQIEAIRHRGTAELIVGIDAHGATAEGLQRAKQLFDPVHIVHNPGGGTFHPKIYLAEGKETAVAFIGSNNLTAGGVYYNYESAVVLNLQNANAADRALLDQLHEYLDHLRNDSGTCRLLTDELLEELLTNPRYGVGRETRAAGLTGSDTDSASVVDTDTTSSAFRRSMHVGPRDPGRKPLSTSPPVADSDDVPATDNSTTDEGPSATGQEEGPAVSPTTSRQRTTPRVLRVVKRWTKLLTGSDAQQKATGKTQVTGNMKLTKAGHEIDHTSYFRHEFFDGAPWTTEFKPRGPLDTATIDIEVFVDGTRVGVFPMVVDHADYRVAAQGNVSTWLKWGAFGDYLRNNDHSGRTASLERLDDSSFRLSIADEPSGDPIP